MLRQKKTLRNKINLIARHQARHKESEMNRAFSQIMEEAQRDYMTRQADSRIQQQGLSFSLNEVAGVFGSLFR